MGIWNSIWCATERDPIHFILLTHVIHRGNKQLPSNSTHKYQTSHVTPPLNKDFRVKYLPKISSICYLDTITTLFSICFVCHSCWYIQRATWGLLPIHIELLFTMQLFTGPVLSMERKRDYSIRVGNEREVLLRTKAVLGHKTRKRRQDQGGKI